MVIGFEPRGIEGAAVYDAKGERIGRVASLHVHGGKLVNLNVRLDPEIASLPGVGVDRLRVAADHVDLAGQDAVRMDVTLRDALAGRAGRSLVGR